MLSVGSLVRVLGLKSSPQCASPQRVQLASLCQLSHINIQVQWLHRHCAATTTRSSCWRRHSTRAYGASAAADSRACAFGWCAARCSPDDNVLARHTPQERKYQYPVAKCIRAFDGPCHLTHLTISVSAIAVLPTAATAGTSTCCCCCMASATLTSISLRLARNCSCHRLLY